MIKINSLSVINIIGIYLKVSLFLILGDPISSAEVLLYASSRVQKRKL